MSRLHNKVALVTGASKGIGAGIARRLASDGAQVVVHYATDQRGAQAVVADIEAAGGRAVAVQADVRHQAEVAALIEATLGQFGRLDVLVNNSGIYQFARIEDSSEALYRQQFDINVLGPLLVTGAAVPFLREGASIINVSSFVTRVLPVESAIYSGTKGALDAITGVLSRELGPRGIRINSINPGMVDTEGAQSAGFIGSPMQTQIVAQTPLGRVGVPDDIADVAVFLASDDARWLTGERIKAGGGLR